MRYLPIAATILACASLSAAQTAPTARPAGTTASAETNENTFGSKHKAAVVGIAQELVRGLGSDSYETREAAQAALADVLRAYLAAVAKHRADKDPEVRKRATAAMKAMFREASYQHAALSLGEAQRAGLKRFRQKRPGIFAGAFSAVPSERVDALKRLARQEDPEALGEPILLVCLTDGSEKVQAAAATAAGNGEYKSDAVVDALLNVLVQHRQRHDCGPRLPGSRRENPRSQAMAALKEIRPKRAVPTLLALMGDEHGHGREHGELSEVIAQTEEKRAIPELIRLLDASPGVWITWGPGPNAVSTAGSDMVLMCLLRLTGQKPAKYGFVRPGRGLMESDVYGFAGQQDRKDAIAKFKTWWEKNRSTAPYKGLKPLVVPELPGSRRKNRIFPGGLPIAPPPPGGPF